VSDPSVSGVPMPAVIDRGWEQVTQAHLDDMVRGWFVGDFEPSVIRMPEAEVAVQRFRAGDIEEEHHHRAAVEVTVIVSGRAIMCGREVTAGDILVLPPGTATSFQALEDTVTAVVKTPSVLGDKYPGVFEGEL
jgi:quercetin dioxygenase-like cupin family protein